MIIKLLLVAGILACAALTLRGRPSGRVLAVRRIAAAVVGLLGVVATLSPGIVTALANRVGVGRGTDLVLYVFVVVALFVAVSLHQRLADLQERYVELARRVALQDAWLRAPDVGPGQHRAPTEHAE